MFIMLQQCKLNAKYVRMSHFSHYFYYYYFWLRERMRKVEGMCYDVCSLFTYVLSLIPLDTHTTRRHIVMNELIYDYNRIAVNMIHMGKKKITRLFQLSRNAFAFLVRQ
jgi:hypothetical protein